LRATPLCGDAVILESVPTGRIPQECDAHAHAILTMPWTEQLAFYILKPGEPPTTPQAIAVADRRLTEEEESNRR